MTSERHPKRRRSHRARSVRRPWVYVMVRSGYGLLIGMIAGTVIGSVLGGLVGLCDAALFNSSGDGSNPPSDKVAFVIAYGTFCGSIGGALQGICLPWVRSNTRFNWFLATALPTGALGALPFWTVPQMALVIVFGGYLGGLACHHLLEELRNRFAWFRRHDKSW